MLKQSTTKTDPKRRSITAHMVQIRVNLLSQFLYPTIISCNAIKPVSRNTKNAAIFREIALRSLYVRRRFEGITTICCALVSCSADFRP
jgi:hypothetical protein